MVSRFDAALLAVGCRGGGPAGAPGGVDATTKRCRPAAPEAVAALHQPLHHVKADAVHGRRVFLVAALSIFA